MNARHRLRLVLASGGLIVALTVSGCAGSADEPAAPGAANSSDAAPSAAATSAAATSDAATAEPSPPVSPSATAQVSPAVREIVVTIAGGDVQPPPGRVEVSAGETVRITVTSDVPDELHVHGFGDPELALAAGVPGSLDIVAGEPGTYDIETHESELVLFQLLVR